MKKLLLLTVILTAYLLTTNASDKTWTFEAWTPSETGIAKDTTIDGLTLIHQLYYTDSIFRQPKYGFAKIKTGRPSKTIEKEIFTASIQTGGPSFINGESSSSYFGTDSVFPIKNFFKFTTTDSSTIKVYFSSGHPGFNRSCKISDGKTILSQDTDSGDGKVIQATTSGSGTVYIYSNDNIYIYKITATNVGKEQLSITSHPAVWLANTLQSKDSVTFVTDSAWTACSNQTWLTLNKISGKGNAAITFSATANTGLARTATITIKGAKREIKNIQITQLGATTSEWDFSHLYLSDGSNASVTNGTKTKYYNATEDVVPAINYNKTAGKKMTLSWKEYPNFTISYTNNTLQPYNKYIILFYDNNICATGKNVYFTLNNVQIGDTLAFCVSSKSAARTSLLTAYRGAIADPENPTVPLEDDLNSDRIIDRYTLKFIATSNQVVLKETSGGIRIYSIKSVKGTSSKAVPDLTWNTPADIVYSTPLSSTQLNASSTVSGSYTYTPSAGTILNAGSGQELNVTFTPTDTTTYTSVSKKVYINVYQVTTGVTDTHTENLIIYPNPVKDYFKLNGIENNAKITVCNMDGSILLRQSASEGTPINISFLPQGTYLLYIDTRNGHTQRILLKK